MKLSRRIARSKRFVCTAVIAAGATALFLATARADLPSWIRNVEARSTLEAVFFRAMQLPGGKVSHRRPPGETRPALRNLIAQRPKDAELYSLLALEDEQQLDFTSAEADWKRFVEANADKTQAELALADFYHRRLRPQDEIKVLSEVANAPAEESERLAPPEAQESWRAFERIFSIIQLQGLSKEVSIAQYRNWIARYPKEPPVYARFLNFLIAQKEYNAASQLVEDYRKQFPEDAIFSVKARALIEYRRGSLPQGLAVYEKTFQPLWDPELVKGYFDLLAQTQSLRKFLDQQRAALNVNPEDLRAAALVFYYYQQEGKLEAAQAEIAKFRMHKESARSPWTSEELYICGKLLEDIHAYPEAARYYFALYKAKDAADSQERALSALTRLLLEAPESPIRFGMSDLSMYRDIATMDQGPGYLNGILSLILNTTDPASEFSQEEQRAVPYFHRAAVAKLLALLDAKFPDSPDRAGLHATLLEYYASAGESDAVTQSGKQFLADFPQAPQRTSIALLMADAYARKGATQEEFAIYDSALKELAAKSQNVPLGNDAAGMAGGYGTQAVYFANEDYEEPGAESGEYAANEFGGSSESETHEAFQAQPSAVHNVRGGPRSAEYAQVLERYLARLAELKQIPQAVAVLRNEIARNPDDPGLYERLAVFLEQNRLGAEQEEVYKRAMARFPDRSWYSKLARFYLRQREAQEFTALTQQVVQLFNGTDLESYFQSVVNRGGLTAQAGPALYVQLNLCAHERFPHNPVFVNNLLMAYQWPQTRDQTAWEQLLREHWFEQPYLRNEFFSYLSSTGQLESDLNSIRHELQANGNAAEFVKENPAAGQFLAQADLWRSHFEESAPLLKELAQEYPADPEISRTASSVFRSLACFHPADTNTAVKIEENLLAANPGNTELLARIGDTLADRDLFTRAVPFWDRIPQVSPGEANGYLDAASIYWDYFDFDNALRLLDEARKKFGDDALYAYEAGAIYEGKRAYPQAVAEYVKGSLANGQGSPAENRLLQLAQRPKYRDLVEAATKNLAEQSGASLAVISLRANVLETLNRKKDLEELLNSAVGRATTLEEAAKLASLARQSSLESVVEDALEKQAALSADPVTRLQLRYELVGPYEKRKDSSAAQKAIEALYRENPKILGVVRATVDFYWRAKLYPQAIAVLQQAARDAYPELSRQFTLEAARKSTQARLYPQARTMLAYLLKDSPYDAQYLAAMADTYAQAGDQQGLKQFYTDEIAVFRSAPLNADAKKAQIAVLRRGLIPALTGLHQYSAAVDQYIELINAFPEDEGLADEATLYAARNHLQQRLVDFYGQTVQQSPHDYRWAMVLARIQTALEDYPAAIEAYGKAIAIRPDRVDLRSARAGLAERLMRFDDAVADYEKLYELAYKDPQWMEKVAEIRARQGRTSDAVAALKAALIDGTPERPGKYFEVARQLEAWGMLSQARSFAEQGVNSTGSELLASTENHSGAALYARVMTRLRQPEAAYTKLQEAFSAASASLPVIEQQVARQGISGVTDRNWRREMQEERLENAQAGMRAALVEMGNTVATYFTPEEKLTFEEFAQKLRAPMSATGQELFAIPLVHAAGLEDLEANWRYALMMAPAANFSLKLQRMRNYARLQRQRLKFEELDPQLEDFATRIPGEQRPSVLINAANAYRSADDSQNELRVLSQVWPGYMGRDEFNRYCELLLQRQPQELVQLASNWTPWGEQAADFVIAKGSPQLAHQVVAARSQVRVPVWRNAYDALTGLYFSEAGPAVNKSFVDALGDQTIGERLGKKLNRNQELAGDIWFYYGSRYGEYLGATRQGNPGDFLPAVLEQSPASSSGYLQVADYYEVSGNTRAAVADYFHVLELNPQSVTARDRLATAYLKQNDRARAIKQWKLALAELSKQVNQVSVPESFWTDFGLVCGNSGRHRMFAELKPGANAVLRAYLKKNGTYRSNDLLKDAYEGLHDPPAATEWLLNLSTAASDSVAVLADVVDAPWIPLAQRAPIYQRILAAKQDAVDKAAELEKDAARDDLRAWQVRWANYLMQSKQFETANEFVNSLPQETLALDAEQFTPIQLQIAAHFGTLGDILAGYRTDEEHAPAADILRTAAAQLQKAGDKESARRILEFVFAREIEAHHLDASNFLGLAEIRIAEGDVPGAMELLRRLVLVVGGPFENLEPAAALLEKTGHHAEAAEFLGQYVQAAPWDAFSALRLAKTTIAAKRDLAAARDALKKIAADPAVPYKIRAAAALAMRNQSVAADFGSKELNMLAAGSENISAAAADQSYFYEVRIGAARNTPDVRAKIQLLRDAVADFPAREEARYDLFDAAAAAHDDQFALAALEGTPRPQVLVDYQTAEENEEAAAPRYKGETENAGPETNAPGVPELTQERQARIASEAAQILVRLGWLQESIPYLQTARKLEKNKSRRNLISEQIAVVKKELRRQRLNQQRQPVLHEALEQNRLVRPRIPRNAAATPGVGGPRP